MKKNKAFTLVEVLICLTVIGVIAALTIPQLQAGMAKKANTEAMKKAYVYLSDVLEIPKALGDPYTKWNFNTLTTQQAFDKIEPHLAIVKNCTSEGENCWAASTKSLKNGTAANFSSAGYGDDPITFKMSDGATVSMTVTNKNLNVTRSHTKTIVFAVDVNGQRKPDKLGDDIFLFVMGDDGLLPAGNDAADGIGDCTLSGEGTDCAARIIRDGNNDYK